MQLADEAKYFLNRGLNLCILPQIQILIQLQPYFAIEPNKK